MLTVATYNVNSIRARLSRLLAWLARTPADVVCLQEIKVADEEFPRLTLEAAGWHAAVHGQRTYNGVAILSRAPLDDVRVGLDDGTADGEARLLSGRTAGSRIVSVYVPNGQTVDSEKWRYKLDWLRRLRGYLERTASPEEPLLVCGDFNVAPDDRDVAFVDQWRDTVLTHEAGRAALRDILGWGLVDTVRRHHPEGPGPYTWWDYRLLGFPKGNGLRIDHIVATPPLAARCVQAYVDRDERKGKQPSDHAPVVAAFGA
ncbi:MAG: exodeoxyribonuclease III [Gemmatimonadales bacterium]